MQPRCRQVPPTLSFSTTATDMPAAAAYRAAAYPPGPPPITTRSNSSAMASEPTGAALDGRQSADGVLLGRQRDLEGEGDEDGQSGDGRQDQQRARFHAVPSILLHLTPVCV